MQASDAIAGIFGYTNWHVIWSGEDELLRTIVGPLGPYWSLAIEEQFYVLLTVAFVVCVRTARPVRSLTFVVVIGWFGSLLAQLLISGPQYRLEFGTDTRGSEILAGCGLAILLHCCPGVADRLRRWLPGAGRDRTPRHRAHRGDERLRPAMAAAWRLQRPLAGQFGARAVVARSRTV